EAYPVYLVESRTFETDESKRLAECFFPEITGYFPHKGSLVLKSEIEKAKMERALAKEEKRRENKELARQNSKTTGLTGW
ncbi:MAG: hypothetical protein II480_09560, partial [Bacteroidales bacterium]|nr:hypothetical protein [Bacteroidales bacterium]